MLSPKCSDLMQRPRRCQDPFIFKCVMPFLERMYSKQISGLRAPKVTSLFYFKVSTIARFDQIHKVKETQREMWRDAMVHTRPSFIANLGVFK